MPPVLVRPYVRALPITHVAPAYPRNAPVVPRPAPPVYRPRHSYVTVVPEVTGPGRTASSVRVPLARRVPAAGRSRPARRRYPALAWGALLLTLTATGLALRPGDDPAGQVPTPAAQTGSLQIAVIPASVLPLPDTGGRAQLSAAHAGP